MKNYQNLTNAELENIINKKKSELILIDESSLSVSQFKNLLQKLSRFRIYFNLEDVNMKEYLFKIDRSKKLNTDFMNFLYKCQKNNALIIGKYIGNDNYILGLIFNKKASQF